MNSSLAKAIAKAASDIVAERESPIPEISYFERVKRFITAEIDPLFSDMEQALEEAQASAFEFSVAELREQAAALRKGAMKLDEAAECFGPSAYPVKKKKRSNDKTEGQKADEGEDEIIETRGQIEIADGAGNKTFQAE